MANTAGAAETIAAVVRNYDRALVVGSNTAGQAVEYADLRLSGGNLLRVAVSQVLLPANLSIFPQGVKPDVPVKMTRADLLTILRGSVDKDKGAWRNSSWKPSVRTSTRPRWSAASTPN